MGLSLAEQFAQQLTPEQQRQWVQSLTPEVLEEIARQEWWWVSRPEQCLPQGPWTIGLILSGRGFGKSRASSEWIVQRALDYPLDRSGFPTDRLVMGATIADVRTINIEGPSGVLRVLDRRKIPYTYRKNPKPVIVLGEEKSRIHFAAADSPNAGRGGNFADAVLDEIAKWLYPAESWYEGIMPALRADIPGDHPRAMVTTTPKPISLIREWVARTDGSVHVVRGSTFDNSANLNTHVLDELERRYS
ncbi:MAG: terminase large subunit domain-containing protein, partial [Nitrospiraceae bacterium]